MTLSLMHPNTYGASCTLKISGQDMIMYPCTNYHQYTVAEPIFTLSPPEALHIAPPPLPPIGAPHSLLVTWTARKRSRQGLINGD